ncbi:MAG: cation transporter [Candidatus Methanofastidiosum sp.]|nr:cation transporter [Methanofastidiosum sp.]
MKDKLTVEERTEKGVKVTLNGLIINIILTIFKFIAGFVGQSSAMIADAVHSSSDMISDIVVLFGFRYVKKPVDSTHNYGHGKVETLATAIVGLMLIVVAFFITLSGFEKLISSLKGNILPRPELIALYAAFISIISKEILYRYTVNIGKKIESKLIVANAWHHRSDAFSSIGTMIGIGGAIFLGEKWRILDPIAAILVSILIFKVAIEISKNSVKELLEASIDEEKKTEIFEKVSEVKGVKDYHKLRIRHVGHYHSMSIHILVDKSLNVTEAHNISTNVENAVKVLLGQETIVTIHIEPF